MASTLVRILIRTSGTLALAVALCPSCSSAPTKARATADELCDFITKEMHDAVPQDSTVCAPKAGTSLEAAVTVFSLSDVLEGKDRRAWSTSLFITLNKLYFGHALNDLCKSHFQSGSALDQWFGCSVTVSDSYLSQQGGKRYHLLTPTMWGDDDPLNKDPSSDQWYTRWWSLRQNGEEFDYAGSANNSAMLIRESCDKYLSLLRLDREITALKAPIPTCSVFLSTDKRAEVLIAFPDAASQSLAHYAEALLSTFGRSFADTPYSGDIIFRGEWLAQGSEILRPLWLHDLGNLKFLWDESSSGVRPSAMVQVVLRRETGQTGKDGPTPGASGGILLRFEAQPDGTQIADFINGGRWKFFVEPKDVSKCLVPGESYVELVGEKMEPIGVSCAPFRIKFIGAW